MKNICKIPVIDLVAGARPNFMKLAPVVRAMAARDDLQGRIVHTGQHYDPGMNDVFFAELGIPEPEVHLEVGSGTHGQQTARILERYEAHLMSDRPAMTVVFGDVNSTVACALAAVKLGIPVCHVEAGLRSFDRTMPEEINRILTDAISHLLLVSEPSGAENLKNEGIDPSKIRNVGNVMIDTLRHEIPRARELRVFEQFGLQKGGYGLITMHRPSNVDDPEILERLVRLFLDLAQELPLVLPLHPRTKGAMERAGLMDLVKQAKGFHLIDPQPYRRNLSLMSEAKLVLTDSGGIQEETAVLNVPCLTMRFNTERPITVSQGTSRLVGNDVAQIRKGFWEIVAGNWQKAEKIPLWDGQAGERIVSEIVVYLHG